MDENTSKILATILQGNGASLGLPNYDNLSRDEHELLRLSFANQAQGSLKGPDCPLCLNRGFSSVLVQGEIRARECSCMPTRRSLAYIEKSGLKPLLDDYTFDRFLTPEPWQKQAKALAISFINDFVGNWFCAFGSVGSGKSHLCTAICATLLNAGLETLYMCWRDDAPRLKASVNDADSYSAIIDPLKASKVLYIDDLFKSGKSDKFSDPRPTAADINLAFELLDARYRNKNLVTILSSEFSVAQILEFDEGIGSRIYERSKKYSLDITKGAGKNWRLRS